MKKTNNRDRYEGYRKRFVYLCMLCGNPGNEIHHIIPISKGGRDIEANIILLCLKCHDKEGLHSQYQENASELLFFKYYAELNGKGIKDVEEIEDEVPIVEERMEEDPPVGSSKKPKFVPRKFVRLKKMKVVSHTCPFFLVEVKRGIRCPVCRLKVFNVKNHAGKRRGKGARKK
jgi:DNA-directed RNA polymerase subunit RPC12/RpoP